MKTVDLGTANMRMVGEGIVDARRGNMERVDLATEEMKTVDIGTMNLGGNNAYPTSPFPSFQSPYLLHLPFSHLYIRVLTGLHHILHSMPHVKSIITKSKSPLRDIFPRFLLKHKESITVSWDMGDRYSFFIVIDLVF